MLERELKNQIVTTLSRYKDRCNKLEDEVSVLKNAIYQLSLLPNGIYVGLDKQMHNLQVNIQENQDPNKIKKSVELLVNAMSDLELKNKVSKTHVNEFIKKATHILGKMIISAKDKKTFEYSQKLIEHETNEQALLTQFTQLLDDSVNWVNEQINFCQQNHSQLVQQQEISGIALSNQINIRLGQLTKHLLIPDNLSAKLNRLKSNLEQQLTIESLGKVIDSLTDLVIETFNLEHNHLKGFLQHFSDNLQDFNSYLLEVNQQNIEAKLDSSELEKSLNSKVKIIQSELGQAKNSKDLTYKIEDHLQLIGKDLKAFRKNQSKRVKSNEKKIAILEAKLVESQSIVNSLRQQFVRHKLTAYRDFLTGLPDRIAFKEYIQGAFYRWQRGYGEITVGLANIDHFKTINNNLGYLAGDSVLKQIATLFRSSLRAADFIARYDGEEFVFILEHTPPTNAWSVFNSLRIAIEETIFDHQDQELTLTMSFGLSSFQHGDTIEKMMTRVHEAMNQAKHSGRNQVVLKS